MSQALLQMLRSRGDHEATNTQSLSEESLKNSRRWTYRDNFDIETTDANIIIQNDLNSDTLRVVAVRIDPDDDITGTVTANATIDTPGTGLPQRNDRITNPMQGPPAGVTIEEGGTYSGGSNALPVSSSGGTGEGANQTAVNAIPTATVRIEPDASLLYEISNDSGSANTVTFEMVVSRVPNGE